MNISLSHAMVPTVDQDAALTFYRDVLGLEVRADVTVDDGFRWLTVGAPGQSDLELVLEDLTITRPAEDQQKMRELLVKGSLGSLIFQVDDVDALFGKVRAAGAEVIQEPTDQFYGVRDCAFRDPSGNHVRFSEPMPAPE